MSIRKEWIDMTRGSDQVTETVDEAVAAALSQVYDKRTGNKDVDDWVEQSLITLGGMVKMVALSKNLDITANRLMLMKMGLMAYRSTIDTIAYEILGSEDDA